MEINEILLRISLCLFGINIIATIIGVIISHSRWEILATTIVESVLLTCGIVYKTAYLPYFEPIVLFLFFINFSIGMIWVKINKMLTKEGEII